MVSKRKRTLSVQIVIEFSGKRVNTLDLELRKNRPVQVGRANFCRIQLLKDKRRVSNCHGEIGVEDGALYFYLLPEDPKYRATYNGRDFTKIAVHQEGASDDAEPQLGVNTVFLENGDVIGISYYRLTFYTDIEYEDEPKPVKVERRNPQDFQRSI